VVYFVEDVTAHVSPTDVRHFSNVTALDVLDAATGHFLVGQSGVFAVLPPGAH
jgi:hypothetical protein